MKQEQQIFILGVSQRSGTNFLLKILEKHPNIIKSSHPGEDFIIENSNYLIKHIYKTQKSWSNTWEGMDKDEYGKKYLTFISNALIDYLSANIVLKKNQYCVTKTPSVENIDNFFKLFPNSKLIILIRNGKNIIESGVKGFGWNYTDAMKMIKYRNELIISFIEKNKNRQNFIVVKYEDLVNNGKKTMKDIFDQFKIDDGLFDYNCIAEIPIYGSSFIRGNKNKLTWSPQNKNKNFKPLNRYDSWTFFQKLKYQIICGKVDKYFYK